MRIIRIIGAMALALVMLPAPSFADWYVAPYVGGQFSSGSRGGSFFAPAIDSERWNLGATGGWTKGWWGIDADLGYHPEFFDDGGGFLTEASLLTLMGNAHVSIPADVRYFRATDDQSATNGFGIRFDGFDFVKTSVGMAFSW